MSRRVRMSQFVRRLRRRRGAAVGRANGEYRGRARLPRMTDTTNRRDLSLAEQIDPPPRPLRAPCPCCGQELVLMPAHFTPLGGVPVFCACGMAWDDAEWLGRVVLAGRV